MTYRAATKNALSQAERAHRGEWFITLAIVLAPVAMAVLATLQVLGVTA